MEKILLFFEYLRITIKNGRVGIFVTIFLSLALASCVEEPSAPSAADQAVYDNALILCEGMWYHNNSSITKIDRENSKIVNQFYSVSNGGLNLGDIGNSFVKYGDTVFVAVTTSKTIEALRISDGTHVGRIEFSGHNAPRDICLGPEYGYVTDLYDHSIHQFDPKKIEYIKTVKTGGPAPEGCVYANGMIITANSGYGDYLAEEPGAGTISIFDDHLNLRDILFVGPNVVELAYNTRTYKLYAMYYNTPSAREKGEKGGIVEYNIGSMEKLREWTVDATSMAFSAGGDSLLFISDKNAGFIDLVSNSEVKILIENPDENENWYSVHHSPTGDFWVCNALNHQRDGILHVYSIDKVLKESINTGVNPRRVIFY